VGIFIKSEVAVGKVGKAFSPKAPLSGNFFWGKFMVIPLEGVNLEGEVELAEKGRGLVLFAHGSGSSRHSPRNQFVARVLRESGIGTLLFDLLTPQEEKAEAMTRHLRFDIGLLATRLAGATQWVLDQESSHGLCIGYFGSSTGAAAALVAAAQFGDQLSAVVSRGGRPDLAGTALQTVKAPTLLLVGSDDAPVIPLNQEAYERLRCKKALRLIPGASHLFAEPGTLEKAASEAAAWFKEHLQSSAPVTP
jgi:pimeloyl-ACP methyl ester carboxylesterase